VAQVPAATTPSAFGARRSIHSVVLIGWPVAASVSHRGPVAVAAQMFVWDRSLDDETKFSIRRDPLYETIPEIRRLLRTPERGYEDGPLGDPGPNPG